MNESREKRISEIAGCQCCMAYTGAVVWCGANKGRETMKKLAAYVAFFHHGEQMKSLPKTAIQRALVAIGPSVYPIYGAERIFGVCFNAPPGSAPASSAKLRGELG